MADGSSFYLYGVDRVAEKRSGAWRYYTSDALGSVRQLVNASGTVILVKSYAPFGEPLTASGSGTSIYSFTGEQRDATGLVFLRSRYLSPAQGRFLTRDVWEGNPESPAGYDLWVYASGNPVNRVDPTGRYWEAPWCERLGTSPEQEQCRNRTLDSWHDRWMEPPYISWNPPQSLPLVTDLPFMSPGAQGRVPDYGTDYPDFCGQVALAPILGLTAKDVVVDFDSFMKNTSAPGYDEYDVHESTYRPWLADYINARHRGWHATIFDWNYRGDRDSSILRSHVSAASYIIALVGITGGNVTNPTPQGGTLGVGDDAISHFAVITGLSRHWRKPHADPYNWVRIFNPFTNGTEYYRWLKKGEPAHPTGVLPCRLDCSPDLLRHPGRPRSRVTNLRRSECALGLECLLLR